MQAGFRLSGAFDERIGRPISFFGSSEKLAGQYAIPTTEKNRSVPQMSKLPP
jgi:hypothetical protein